MMRKGEDHSFVEVCLYLPNHEKAIEDTVIVSREIYSNGRNLCKINGRMVTVTELKAFMSHVIDIHGQNENQSLLEVSKHISYLDNFSGEKLITLKQNYKMLYEQYLGLKAELTKNYGDDKEKQRKLDLLKYQLTEIEEAKLKKGEEEELDKQRKIMMNAQKLADHLQEADKQIGEITLDAMNIAIRNLEKIEDIDSKIKDTLNNLKSNYYDLQEMAREMGSFKEDIDFDEGQRREIEERLDLLFSLKRKYGNTTAEILEYKEQLEEEITTIENLEEYTNGLKEEISILQKKMYQIAKQMNEIRQSKSKELASKINQELKDLEMKHATFAMQIQFNERQEFTKNGLDQIEFLIATNIGEDAKPLSKIASGGEMSRIMLAIKTVLAKVDEMPILIFDEIDTGISGTAANMVGGKLKTIASSHQVLVITHQASIAAKGEYNYYIHKEVTNKKTETKVELLKEEEVVKEIARIASGTITKIAIEHAKELRKVV